ncbi:YitT family protein [Aerococcaceae bacterium DSM 111020]|nr:YitT family protein [Aerococcaceae bacterium DSM 111020]
MLANVLSKIVITKKQLFLIIMGTMIMAFGIVNVHTPSQITEGGVLGLVLFSNHVLKLDPSFMTVILDLLCHSLGYSMMGWVFLQKAAVATLSFASFYKLFMLIGPLLPNFYNKPFIAAVLGGIFIGVGCGLVVTQGGAAGGDDALAMVIAKRLNCNISMAYLLTDGVVLLLSLTYIAPERLFFSFITTIVSSLIIGLFELHLVKPNVSFPEMRRTQSVNSW